MKNFFKHNYAILIVVIGCHLIGVLVCGDFSGTWNRVKSGNLKDQARLICQVNNDEILIGEVAINHRHGLGYSSSKENRRGGYIYDFTAYRPTYPVYLHMVLQSVYLKVFPGKIIEASKRDPYFLIFGGLAQLISFLLFLVSLYYFYQIALLLCGSKLALISLVLYGIHPSVMCYVGNLVNYESMVTSLVIVMLSIILMAISKPLSKGQVLFFLVGFIFSVLFRPQTLFIFLFLLGSYFLISLANRNNFKSGLRQSLLMISACFILFVIFNIPVLQKNHRLFDAWTLGTTGFNFSLGHNPYARGGWCGDCFVNPGSPYYQYIREQIPGYEKMNEYDKSKNLQDKAISWILSNPKQELILVARKVAIYFIPVNNDQQGINILNLCFHLGTILFLLLFFYKLLSLKMLNQGQLILLSPLAGSLLVTILFHVGYRWRYYAEPFMIIMTLIVIDGALKKYLYVNKKPKLEIE